jgi:hypothetical protein
MTGETTTDEMNNSAPSINEMMIHPNIKEPMIHPTHPFPSAPQRQQMYAQRLQQFRPDSSKEPDDSANSNKKNDDSADSNNNTDDSAGSSKKSGRMTFLSTGPAPQFTSSPSLKAELGEEMDECFEARWTCDKSGWLLTFEPIRGVDADALTAARVKWNKGDFLCKTCRGTGLKKLETGTGSGGDMKIPAMSGGSRSRSRSRSP